MSVRQPLHFEPGRHNFPFCTMDTLSKYSEYLQCLLRCTTCVRVYFGRNHKNHKKSANADPEYFLPTKGQYVASNSTGPDNPFAFHLRRNVRPIRHATAKLQHDTIFLVDPCIVTMTSIMRRCPMPPSKNPMPSSPSKGVFHLLTYVSSRVLDSRFHGFS